MADKKEDTSREDLTEEASPHKLEELRNKGMVAQSKEVSALAVLLAVGFATYTLSPKLGYEITEYMREAFRTDQTAKLNLNTPQTLHHCFSKIVDLILGVGLPICVVGFVFGFLSCFAQVGSIFTFEPIQPNFEKIDPIQGFQRLVSSKQALDGLKLVVKLAILIGISVVLIKAEVLKVPSYFGSDVFQVLTSYSLIVKSVFGSFIGILVVFAAADFGLQKFEYSKSVRMTKQEAKQEHREREGDPQIKARIRLIQREMSRKRMMQAVRKADVIVTNPTHIAIALVYDKATMSAPRVVAKGADYMAERIKAVAAEAGVPRVENVPLARALYKSVKVNQSVPRSLYQAVAEILAYVYRLRKRPL